MSIRVCAKCSRVIDNGHYQEWDCPDCGSAEMACPLTDERDWHKMHEEQKMKDWGEALDKLEKVQNKNLELVDKILKKLGRETNNVQEEK